jgi:hypothetical protein
MSYKLQSSRVSEWRGQMALKDLANLLCSDDDTSGVLVLAKPALNLDLNDDDDDLDGLFDSDDESAFQSVPANGAK